MSLRQRGRDIFHAQGKMMQAFTAPRDETADLGLRGQGFQQLDARGTGAEECDSNFGKAFVALEAQAEPGLEVRAGCLYGTDRPAEVIDGGHRTRPIQALRSHNNRPSGGRY